MGKRSNFERRPRDSYATPYEAVVPLLAHLRPITRFDEPCCGEGALIRHLLKHEMVVARASDIEPGIVWAGKRDALEASFCMGDCFITNPPWDRKILHPLIERLSSIAPTWLLFDANWLFTRQAVPYLPYLHKVVTVGRVKWIPGSKMAGKDDSCWYLFDQTTQRMTAGPVLFGRINK
jgi:hypothetical protein